MDSEQRGEASTAPLPAECSDLDLEVLAEDVAELAKSGRTHEALGVAAAFSHRAQQELGPNHPVYLNALATAAAVVDSMGGKEEADRLLLKAEGLQDADQASRRCPKVTASCSSDGRGSRVLRSTEDDNSDASYDDDWNSLGGGDGDDESDGSASVGHEAEDDDEAEAEMISRLTWEVNTLIDKGHPEQAGQLLGEAERILAGAHGFSRLNGVSRAALHTLWAAVLDGLGESEKARDFYGEAMQCLEEEVGAMGSANNSTTDGDSTDESTDAGEELQVDPKEFSTSRESPATEVLSASRESPVTEASTSRESALAEATSTSRESPVTEDGFFVTVGAPERIEASAGRDLPTEPPQQQQQQLVPKAPPAKSGSARPVRRPVPLAPQPKATAPRVGGGFAACGSVQPPKAPPRASAHKLGPSRKAKAKASSSNGAMASSSSCAATTEHHGPEPSKPPDEEDGQGNAEIIQHQDKQLPGPLTHTAKASAPKEPSKTVEEQKEELSKAVTAAEHFLGLMDIQRASDVLEEQLSALCDGSSSPLRHSDQHVDLLVRYSGVLWWEGNMPASIDALLAADEVLAGRLQNVDTKLQRADVCRQLGAVYRSSGNLEAADRQLSDAARNLAASAASGLSDEAAEAVRASLREVQACLAQVCVHRCHYKRAEHLYVAAFAAEEDRETSVATAAADEMSFPAGEKDMSEGK